MTKKIRFGAFLHEVRAHRNLISFNDLVPETIIDKDGNRVHPPAPVVKVHPLDIYRLLQPYLTVRIIEQIRSVVPLAVYLMLFQLLILRQDVIDSTVIIAGLIAVIIGLMFFMEVMVWPGWAASPVDSFRPHSPGLTVLLTHHFISFHWAS